MHIDTCLSCNGKKKVDFGGMFSKCDNCSGLGYIAAGIYKEEASEDVADIKPKKARGRKRAHKTETASTSIC